MAQNSSDPNMVLDHGRYKGTALKDVPDSYVKWMINYSEGEMQFWQAEQMRRKLMIGTQDGTPLIIEMRCAIRVSAYSCNVYNGICPEESARYRIGWSAGFTFVNVGGVGMPCGNNRAACVIVKVTKRRKKSRAIERDFRRRA